jgi:septal ring factor EnvC (AmiA/AmiB activator)
MRIVAIGFILLIALLFRSYYAHQFQAHTDQVIRARDDLAIMQKQNANERTAYARYVKTYGENPHDRGFQAFALGAQNLQFSRMKTYVDQLEHEDPITILVHPIT